MVRACLPVLLSLAACAPHAPQPQHSVTSAVAETCDVVVAGGSTAALSAALTAAREGAQTCLLEPTDWPGGQLTAGGVPAVDFPWHSVPGFNMAAVGRAPANLPPELTGWMKQVGNPGNCWVSLNCFEPEALLAKAIRPAIAKVPLLRVFHNTVVKRLSLTTVGGTKQITKVVAVRRFPRGRSRWRGYDRRLSEDLPEWYSAAPTTRFGKQEISFGAAGKALVVVDATELGDVLVLSGGAYQQGAAPQTDRCGQSFTLPFVMRLEAGPVPDTLPAREPPHPERYGLKGFSWNKVWTYRRLKGSGPAPAVGELSCQNWELGNDFAHGYLLKGKSAAALETKDWRGGVDLAVLEAAERQAYGWFRWLRWTMPGGLGNRLSLDRGVFAAGHGLSKFPYLRDTRRSVGVGGFVLQGEDLLDDGSGVTARRFADRVAIGLYAADIHRMVSCVYPRAVYFKRTTYPFYIPLRALTHVEVKNLLVAGKTMAQSFIANEATRVHPVELSSGIGAGAAAAAMVSRNVFDTNELLLLYPEVQQIASKHTPIAWTAGGKVLPGAKEKLEPVAHLSCPAGAAPDLELGYCVDGSHAIGHFTQKMIKDCQLLGGGATCTAKQSFTVAGQVLTLSRWKRSIADKARGTGACMAGAQPDAVYPEVCVEEAKDSLSGVKEAYGPFGVLLVRACLKGGGGAACRSSRWTYAFFAKLRSKV